LKCPLCRQRKGRRRCPARDALICSHCCGTKRRVEIACPEDCVYLSGAHSAAWEGRTTEMERDRRRVGPQLEPLNDAQRELYFIALIGLRDLAHSRRDLDDRLLADALRTLLKTIETRTRGLIYEHQAEDARAQALVPELVGLFQTRDESERAVSPRDADLLAVLGALTASLAATAAESGERRAFLEMAARLTAHLSARPAETQPRILLG
jgi:hypothetical protein